MRGRGVIDNAVFLCGQAVIDGKLFVYHSSADRALCVATCELSELLGELLRVAE